MVSWKAVAVLLLVVAATFDARSHHGAKRHKTESGKKRASSGAGTEAGTAAETGANTGVATASDTKTESQTFTNTKVNTRIATSSNARSGANAAAKVKTYAHANTETKVDTEQESPHPPTTTPQPQPTNWPEKGGQRFPNGTIIPGTGECGGGKCPAPIIKVYCPKCPCPCPAPCPCKCPCLPKPTQPAATRPPPICLPPCIPLTTPAPSLPPPPPPPPPPPEMVPCLIPPCNPQPIPICLAPGCMPNNDPYNPMCMPCLAPPCPPCPYFKRSNMTDLGHKKLKHKNKRKTREEKRAHQHKRMNSAGKPPDPKEAPLEFDNAAVAADNEICSKIGADILKKKGTAADAIVSTHCCVEIVNSHSTGLGGGGFMVYYDKKTGNKKAYDFRESLVAAYTDSSSKTQGETILVPGVLRGLEAVHKDFGVLPWKDLWQPCIKLAREGFRIHEALAAGIKKKKDYIESNLGLRELFAPDGTILTLGDMLKRPKLARTFEKIANEGPEVFYRGTMAKQIVEDIRAAGGVMTVDDLAGFQVRETNPLQTKVNGMDVLTVPAPASGALMALSLKILAEGKWNPQKFTESPETYYHEYIEAMKLAYAPTTYLSDPRFSNITEQVEKYMIDDSTAKTMYKKIDGNAHNIEDYKPYSQLFATEKTGTSHMSILDQNGSAVSLTSSINAYFGSKLRSRELGFIYNNELADFSEFWPKIYNLTSDVKIPGKRPMSRSMPTVFLKNKEVQGVWGAAGGFFIPAAITMSIANWMFFNDNLKVAITRPRLHCQLFPPTVVYEPTLPPQMIPKLEAFSHQSVTNSTYDVSGQLNAIMGVVQAIVRKDNGKIAAECDYRKGGRPAGF